MADIQRTLGIHQFQISSVSPDLIFSRIPHFRVLALFVCWTMGLISVGEYLNYYDGY